MCSYHAQTFLAVECLRKCLYYDAEHVDAMLQLARIMRRSGYISDCLTILNEAVRVGKTFDVRVQILLAETLIELDKREEALDVLNRIQDNTQEEIDEEYLIVLTTNALVLSVCLFISSSAIAFVYLRFNGRVKENERTAKALKKAIKRQQSNSSLQ
ncbi:hypothetical protein, variant [Sphaeroforma arctica JP610]|uniref:Uncharacterized protein n=1 Tax=Sphaeroforma arctica JP610 TaxID=667725 RepID=A0A0L0FS40_9EUKA|nr:hypothetical protein, variant [Sphaeroforma arctica JP610]KNC79602.1 hypothetical protein, variant [Sphaeroforma arctica JP610]|eukprot:XP_014153504.1 hypothetical protein, variant [Sphaeroforma arctica JP610]